jgi:hypothetical protein
LCSLKITHLATVRTEAKVLHSLTSVLGSTEEQRVRTSGGTQSKLVQSQSLTTSLLDSGPSSGCETRAATDSLGTVRRRLSSVTVPITTTVLPFCDSLTLETRRESETGGRLIRDIKRRRSTTLLKLESVRPVGHFSSAFLYCH